MTRIDEVKYEVTNQSIIKWFQEMGSIQKEFRRCEFSVTSEHECQNVKAHEFFTQK